MINVELKKVIAELVGAIQWCSGSADFNRGGQAAEGWEKICRPAISLGERTMKAILGRAAKEGEK